MILAIDVQYTDNQGFIAAISFDTWDASEPNEKYETILTGIAEYNPGQFYKRELPCILQLLDEHDLNPEIIIIDGYVTLNKENHPGLGMHLYNARNGASKIIGVAKRSYAGIDEQSKILRGNSKNPLFITSAGIDLEEAKNNISKMHGNNRIPILLKLVDRLCREKADTAALDNAHDENLEC